ncbi:dienelactone hydrolase family protein [Lysobacter sp. Root494]|uniref:dienelactone hydrolase family protein n=1 Tax=Lysobacter sp. Root494 TaxID=1736549 RepID=UPI0006FE7D0A|nr:dienelactone hydrolase family protein [Lysobacter sp. Root494]KQY51103.1 dienelactone hydrolase [Lysobacter sp. Root494]
MHRLLAAALLLLFATPVFAAMQARPVEWKIGKQAFAGYVVYDDAAMDRRPGIVMVPNWMGVNAAAVEKAKRIAGDKYVILLADVYGKGVHPRDHAEAMKALQSAYAAPEGLAARAAKAVDVLKSQQGKAPLDVSRMGAIGFCFGGGAVLDLARSGADIAGVVSFHGNLKASAKPGPEGIKASVLVLNGADDASVTGEDRSKFVQQMNEAKADWQLVDFGGTVHCFTEPEEKAESNCRYNERSATRAFRMMDDFFTERFGKK